MSGATSKKTWLSRRTSSRTSPRPGSRRPRPGWAASGHFGLRSLGRTGVPSQCKLSGRNRSRPDDRHCATRGGSYAPGSSDGLRRRCRFRSRLVGETGCSHTTMTAHLDRAVTHVSTTSTSGRGDRRSRGAPMAREGERRRARSRLPRPSLPLTAPTTSVIARKSTATRVGSRPTMGHEARGRRALLP
jgi:hypothetical protein